MIERSGSHAVYAIAVAAELVGAGEQALRLYERLGLVTPARTAGGTRRYSDDDIAVLRRVTELLEHGVNLAGAKMIIELESANEILRRRLRRRPAVQ